MLISGLNPYQFELMRMDLTNLNRRKKLNVQPTEHRFLHTRPKVDLDRSLSDNHD
jgi:hypothetical protein